MPWKLQHPQPALINKVGPSLLLDNGQSHIAQPTKLQKLNELGYKVLPHPLYSPDLSPTNHHFFKHLDNFLQGKRFHSQKEAENAFQEFTKSQSMDFYTIGNNLFLVGKNMLIVMVPILINKVVFDLSYNDLKFRAQNHNYVCT